MKSTILLAVAACLAVSNLNAFQSPYDAQTPPVLATGGPPAMGLSNIDSVDLYNRSLGVSIPLLQVGGRGDAGYTMSVPVDYQWNFNYIGSGNYEYSYGSYNNSDDLYRPASMTVRHAGVGSPGFVSGCGSAVYPKTISRIYVHFGGGGEMELRDAQSDGQPYTVGGTGVCNFDRGTIWKAIDGSATTFVASGDISDVSDPAGASTDHPDGILYLRNGLKYYFHQGHITDIVDRNGNKVTFDETFIVDPGECSGGHGIKINDPLNREIDISMGCPWDGPGAYQDYIRYSGKGGATETITVGWRPYRWNDPTAPYAFYTHGQLFWTSDTTTAEEGASLTFITLANGFGYLFQYTDYGEPSRIELPTQAAIEYSWQNNFHAYGDPSTCGVMGDVTLSYDTYGGNSRMYDGTSGQMAMSRHLCERREYLDGTTLTRKTTYDLDYYTGSNPISDADCSTGLACFATHLEDWDYTASSVVSPTSIEDHYFYGCPMSCLYSYFPPADYYPPWYEGREFQTNYSDPTTLKRQKIVTWENRLAPSWWTTSLGPEPGVDVRVFRADTLYEDGATGTRQDIYYSTDPADNSNNPLDVRVYDYGYPIPSSPKWRTVTSYMTTGYTDTPIHLRSLPQTVLEYNQWGGIEGKTTFGYDENSLSMLYDAPQDNDPGSTTPRGNVTTVNRWRSSGTADYVTTQMSYDSVGNVRTVVDPNSNHTTISFSLAACGYSLPDHVTNAKSQTASNSYECNIGKPTSTTDIAGHITTYEYDDFGRTTKISRPTDSAETIHSWTQFAYLGLSWILTYQDQNATGDQNLVSVDLIDNFGRPQIHVQPDGSYVETTYDGLGRVHAVSNTSTTTEWSYYSYDNLGRTTQVVYPDLSTESYAYWNNYAFHQDPAGKNSGTWSDLHGGIEAVEEQQSGTWACDTSLTATTNVCTNYNYDHSGNLLTVWQGSSQTRQFAYDWLGQLIAANYPEVDQTLTCPGVSGTWSTCYTYDNNGNLLTKQSPGWPGNGPFTTTMTYDEINRVTSKSYDGYSGTNADPVYYTYDTVQAGCLSSESQGTISQIAFTEYNPGCQVSKHYQEWAVPFNFEYSYDLSGALTREKYPSTREVYYSYTGGGALDKVCNGLCANNDLYASGFGYTQYGLPTNMTMGNGLAHTWSYNNRMQLSSIQAGTLFSLANTYGSSGTNNGNIVGQTVNGGSLSYSYDNLNRLTSASLASTWSESYSYDRYGNRAVTGRTGSLPSLSLETPSAVTDYNASTNRIGTTGFNYDPRGFVITTPSRSDIEYDKADRQIAVTFLGNTTYSYYDPEDRRAAKCNSSWTLCDIYFYDAFGRLAEIFDWSNYNDYIYGLGLLATDGGTWESGTTLARRYVTSDQVGSKRLVTDGSGSTLTTHDYLPFGEEIGGSGCGTLPSGAKFTGQYRDQETCQDYFMARYLTPASGRFMTPDEPLLDQWTSDGQSWNLYGYARNNPLAYIDPSGMAAECANEDPNIVAFCVTRTERVPGFWNFSYDCRSFLANCTQVYLYPPPQGPQIGPGPTEQPQPPQPPQKKTEPKQTFNQCMAANASNFSLVGGVDKIFGTSFRNTWVGGLIGGNSITGLIYGSTDDNAQVAMSNASEALTRGIGQMTTYGRRTSTIMSLNIPPLGGRAPGGLPQALESSTGALRGTLGVVGKILGAGFSFEDRLAIDGVLAAAEAGYCAITK